MYYIPTRYLLFRLLAYDWCAKINVLWKFFFPLQVRNSGPTSLIFPLKVVILGFLAYLVPKIGLFQLLQSTVNGKMHNLQLSSSYYITFICILHIAQQVKNLKKNKRNYLLINCSFQPSKSSYSPKTYQVFTYLDIFCKKKFTFLVKCYSQLKQLFSEKLPITLSRDFCIFANTPYTSRLMRKKLCFGQAVQSRFQNSNCFI